MQRLKVSVLSISQNGASLLKCCPTSAEQQFGAPRLSGRQSLGQVQRVVHQMHHQDGRVRQAATWLHHVDHGWPDHLAQSRMPRHPRECDPPSVQTKKKHPVTVMGKAQAFWSPTVPADSKNLHSLHSRPGHHDLLWWFDSEPHSNAQCWVRTPYRPGVLLCQPVASAGNGRCRDWIA